MSNYNRNLYEDLQWLVKCQDKKDLSDEYLKRQNCITRESFKNDIPEYCYGITFVESSIAREWLERAIEAENYINKLIHLCNNCSHSYPECKPDKIKFGNGYGNDNIVKCSQYTKKI